MGHPVEMLLFSQCFPVTTAKQYDPVPRSLLLLQNSMILYQGCVNLTGSNHCGDLSLVGLISVSGLDISFKGSVSGLDISFKGSVSGLDINF